MNTITKIEVFNLAPENLGIDVTESDAAGYRTWLAGELSREYPKAEIDLSDEHATFSFRIETESDDPMGEGWDEIPELQANLQYFLEEAFDRCPWSWAEPAGSAINAEQREEFEKFGY